ncbi:uncharacterized membrane protein At3g27390-like [Mangifera indica]|uniref:uncharacterized membrane protein At3g27390-like n=1 Tax=Mangifera indica TaxID=29780 RepID=UPI001CFA1EC0|nr:uncharacterized membrane protein At3g27390-like [Mangifera indica]XP_044465513.1 uncharacterized membrane protein At3g27390-like [Mangifera indica]
MEPPRGFLASLWNFVRFLPYFFGLLLLGVIKGIIFFPFVCLIMTIGNSAIILGLLPVHVFWTYYSILRAKQLGPVLKLFICICMPVFFIVWLVVGIVGSIIMGGLYGFLSPIFATFDAVGEGKNNNWFHCFYDGTWSTVKGSFTVVRDFRDVCFHSYFSVMDDLQQKKADVKYYEIRLLDIPGATIAGVLGVLVDFPVISVIAICKSPYMLFKGWHRLFHDLIGREGPFLETICVPFAGLAILLWPLAVVGAVLGSILATIFLGAYAGVVVYKESSFWFGLCYIVASLSIYDEYSNDILGMPEGSCFPRPRYQTTELSPTNSLRTSFTESDSSQNPSFKPTEFKPFEFLEGLLKECKRHGEIMILEGLITGKDIEDAKSNTGSRVVSIGLPAYCLFKKLVHSAKHSSSGILLADDSAEITTTNRPKDAFFDWFLNPFLIMKDQIRAKNLSDEEEDYLGKLVLLCGDLARLKNSNGYSPPESEHKRAELDALARRLLGLTNSISRYPTYRRHFDNLIKTLSEDLAKKNGDSKSADGAQKIQRSKSALARIQKSFKRIISINGSDQESTAVVRDVSIA